MLLREYLQDFLKLFYCLGFKVKYRCTIKDGSDRFEEFHVLAHPNCKFINIGKFANFTSCYSKSGQYFSP